jgi:iron complex outermembrane receptor protein
MLVSGQYLRGDESNQNPQAPGYGVTSLHTRYQIYKWLELFANIDNVLNQRYYTYGALGSSQGVPPGNQNQVRLYSPSEPLAGLVGLRAQL